MGPNSNKYYKIYQKNIVSMYHGVSIKFNLSLAVMPDEIKIYYNISKPNWMFLVKQHLEQNIWNNNT